MKLFLVGVLGFASVCQLHATLDFYDSFNYASTGVALTNAAPSIWVPYTGGLTGGVTNNAGSLSYPGLQTASGDNSVVFSGTAPSAGVDAHSLSQLYNSNNVTTLYYSLTFKVTFITTNDWGNSPANYTGGSFMMGFNQKLTNGSTLAQGDAAAPVLIRTGDPFNADTNVANNFQGYQLGTGVTAATAARTYDASHSYTTNDTLFLVLSYTFNSGATNDVAKLYVNPVPGSLESANTPVVTAVGTNVNNSQVQSFFLRNNSVEPGVTQIDDLRVGTTWADVTPVSSPTLRIEKALPNVLISWPTNNNTGFLLESNAVINTTNWGTVPNTVGTVGDRFYVTNDASIGNLFFRLRK